jgi:hypothetical protein
LGLATHRHPNRPLAAVARLGRVAGVAARALPSGLALSALGMLFAATLSRASRARPICLDRNPPRLDI